MKLLAVRRLCAFSWLAYRWLLHGSIAYPTQLGQGILVVGVSQPLAVGPEQLEERGEGKGTQLKGTFQAIRSPSIACSQWQTDTYTWDCATRFPECGTGHCIRKAMAGHTTPGLPALLP